MIVVDVETTGLNPYKNSLVSVAALDFNNPKNTFYVECRVDHDAEIEFEALKVNGMSVNQIRDFSRPSVEQTLRQFIEWTKSCTNLTFAGENPATDKEFLRVACEKHGIAWNFGYRTVDLHSLAYAELLKKGIELNADNKLSNLSLSTTLQMLGLPEQPKPHNSLTDAKMEAEAISRIVYKKNLLPEFSDYVVSELIPITNN